MNVPPPLRPLAAAVSLAGQALGAAVVTAAERLGVEVDIYDLVEQSCSEPAATSRRVLEVVLPLSGTQLVAGEQWTCGEHS